METTKRPRIVYLLLAAMFIITAAVAMPTTSAKYATTKSYVINIQTIAKAVREYVASKTINLSGSGFSDNGSTYTLTTTSLKNSLKNESNASTANVYWFTTHTDTGWFAAGTKYKIDSTNLYNGDNDYSNERIDGASSRHWKGEKIKNYLTNTFGAESLTPTDYSNNSLSKYPYVDSSFPWESPAVNGSMIFPNQTYTVTVDRDLPEGWYFVQMPYHITSLFAHTMYVYSLFYLPAADKDLTLDGELVNPDKIAIREGGKITFHFINDGRAGIDSKNHYKRLDSITFDQVRFEVNG